MVVEGRWRWMDEGKIFCIFIEIALLKWLACCLGKFSINV
jgi:hypothetical protein